MLGIMLLVLLNVVSNCMLKFADLNCLILLNYWMPMLIEMLRYVTLGDVAVLNAYVCSMLCGDPSSEDGVELDERRGTMLILTKSR